jgi:hypothetical protein
VSDCSMGVRYMGQVTSIICTENSNQHVSGLEGLRHSRQEVTPGVRPRQQSKLPQPFVYHDMAVTLYVPGRTHK